MDRDSLVTLPSRTLRRKSRKIGKVTPQVRQLARDMQAVTLDWEAHREKETGVALAAVQIGVLQRVIVVRKSFSKNTKTAKEFKTYLNAEIIDHGTEVVERHEGCLSVKDIYGLVLRYERITVRAQTLTGQTIEFAATGFLARIFQHEIDHTNGLLYIDRVKKPLFYKLNEKDDLSPLPPADYRRYHLPDFQR